MAKGINAEEFELIKEQTYKFIVHTRDQLIGKYASAVSVANNNYSSILTLSINDGLAENAQQFLDTLTKEYIHQTIENQIEINENTLRFIDKQISQMTHIIDSLELILDSYSDDNEIVDLSQKEQNAFNQLSKTQEDLAEIEIEINSIDKIQSSFGDINSTDLIPSIFATTYQDGNLQNMINKVLELKQRRHNFLMDVTPQDSRIVRIDNELNGLTMNINQYISDLKKMLLVKKTDFYTQISALEKVLKNIPKSKREMLGIERKLTVNENLYNFLLEKRASTIIARAGIVPETNVVEKARSLGVIGPDRQKYIYISFGVGFVLSLIVGFLRTMFFERIENTKELKVATRLPVIGGVPFYDQANDFPISIVKAPRSNISESFRSIRTNLQFILGGEGSKVILVSSLHPGEGKTFVTVNIAATTSQSR